MFEVNWTTESMLSTSSLEVAMDCAEYAWPKTIQGCWKRLETLLIRDAITETTYNEIKEKVTFEEVEDF